MEEVKKRAPMSLISINCSDCGAVVETRSRKRLYCDGCKHARKTASDAAYRSDNRKSPRKYVCERCGSEGECSGRGRPRYCADCSNKVRLERNREYDKRRRPALIIGADKNCLTCEETFTQTGPRQVHCPECIRAVNAERVKRWSEENPDKVLANIRAYNDRNREGVNARNREISKRPHVRARRREWDRQYRQQPKQRLDQRMKTAISHALKGNKRGRSWESLVGYTADQLYVHIERQFLPGMSWENIGEWHIDHIVPKSSFLYEDENSDEFRACWALANLRPLWSEDNLSKGPKRLLLI